ncbi:MAG TPA: flagellar basal body rod protein FlgB [Steroidobacter sp.]|jgi:flagellar basal-body rod protein FlgB|nr:flagellar basal body rod protein FlgB [Steroidobacteraceae bacterium]HLS81615.1 flagellar basal body rod protein FlgB [Steroidobacter sp.]
MAIHFDKVLALNSHALQLRAERTKVLASNLANESTPGYQARDFDFAASLRQALGEEMLAGAPLSELGGAAPDLLYRVPNHRSQDGNTVELGVEQAAFAQNAADFQVALTFTQMKLRGLAKAIEG